MFWDRESLDILGGIFCSISTCNHTMTAVSYLPLKEPELSLNIDKRPQDEKSPMLRAAEAQYE